MAKFLIRRAMFVLAALIGATAVALALSRMGDDPVLLYAKPSGYGDEDYLDSLRAELGTDRPLVVQYFGWVRQLVQGDLGGTLLAERPVIEVIQEKIRNMPQFAFPEWFFAAIIGVPLGILSAVKRATIRDYLGRSFGFEAFRQALHVFWLGMILVLVFAVMRGLLPVSFRNEPGETGFNWLHFILPAIAIGCAAAAGYLRITRLTTLESLDSEFVKPARVKGAGASAVVWKRAFKNALMPALTVLALLLAGLLNGVVVAEVISVLPILVEAVNYNDFQLLVGVAFTVTIVCLIINFAADTLYAWGDPRIRCA